MISRARLPLTRLSIVIRTFVFHSGHLCFGYAWVRELQSPARINEREGSLDLSSHHSEFRNDRFSHATRSTAMFSRSSARDLVFCF